MSDRARSAVSSALRLRAVRVVRAQGELAGRLVQAGAEDAVPVDRGVLCGQQVGQRPLLAHRRASACAASQADSDASTCASARPAPGTAAAWPSAVPLLQRDQVTRACCGGAADQRRGRRWAPASRAARHRGRRGARGAGRRSGCSSAARAGKAADRRGVELEQRLLADRRLLPEPVVLAAASAATGWSGVQATARPIAAPGQELAPAGLHGSTLPRLPFRRMSSLTVYGTTWCGDCKRAKQLLGEQRVAYDFVDIDADEQGLAYVLEVNEGKSIIPVVAVRGRLDAGRAVERRARREAGHHHRGQERVLRPGRRRAPARPG